jgi:hypothetical protein
MTLGAKPFPGIREVTAKHDRFIILRQFPRRESQHVALSEFDRPNHDSVLFCFEHRSFCDDRSLVSPDQHQ